jgi:hypothetical protein
MWGSFDVADAEEHVAQIATDCVCDIIDQTKTTVLGKVRQDA